MIIVYDKNNYSLYYHIYLYIATKPLGIICLVNWLTSIRNLDTKNKPQKNQKTCVN